MNDFSNELTTTEERIIAAAIRTLIRYGEKKTTMADIAKEAGVVRQTVYTAFGGKDPLIARCVRYLSDQNMGAVRKALINCKTIGDKLDAYINNTVVKSFDLMETAVDSAQIVSSNNTAGQDALTAAKREQTTLVEEIFAPYSKALSQHNETPETIARFVVVTAMAIKASAKDRPDLERLIVSLRRSIICLTKV